MNIYVMNMNDFILGFVIGIVLSVIIYFSSLIWLMKKIKKEL